MSISRLELEMLRRHMRVFHEEINGIRDVYHNNLSNFEATRAKFSEKID